MIEQTIIELTTKFNLVLVSKVGPFKKVGDIDFFAKKADEHLIIKYLNQNGFVYLNKHKRGFGGGKFIEGEYFLLDFAFDCDVFLSLYPASSFTEAFYNVVWEDPSIEKFCRYAYSLREQEKYTKFVSENFETYKKYLFDKKYINRSPFKRILKEQHLIKAMQKNKLAIILIFKRKALFSLLLQFLKIRLQRINKGKIVAFVGSDGAGKTTTIEYMNYALALSRPIKTQYMGDYHFMLHRFYMWLHKKHIFFARLCYPFYFVENWLRYLKIRWWKFRGYTVLTDRWPGLNRHLRKAGLLLKLNDWMYRIYPDPDAYVFVSADPEVVHARRDELTVKEIETLQTHMRERLLGNKNSFETLNENLDDSLNRTLQFMYSIY